VAGSWRRLHNEKLYNLYTSPNIISVIKSKMMRWAGHVAHMGEIRHAYNILIGKPEGKRPLGGPGCKWEDNIQMDLTEIGCEGVDWRHLAQDRDLLWALVNMVMDLRVQKKAENFLSDH